MIRLLLSGGCWTLTVLNGDGAERYAVGAKVGAVTGAQIAAVGLYCR
jgi:hypothetical protein